MRRSIWVAFLLFYRQMITHTHTHTHTNTQSRKTHSPPVHGVPLVNTLTPWKRRRGGLEGKPSRSARLFVHHQQPRPKGPRKPILGLPCLRSRSCCISK
ncbi:hypothetical protein LZ30DRAFT_336644 [Colletotrichum cereale]|nr:hypothetical protein LZ30DRAFT_336644 [Colletotrichum cereale]